MRGAGDWDPIGRQEFVRRSLQQGLAFAPGDGYRYSNAGYSLLGAVIEQLSGQSCESFLRERLWLPHGLYETGYVLPRWGETRLAQGYRRGERWGTVLERPFAEDGPYWVLRCWERGPSGWSPPGSEDRPAADQGLGAGCGRAAWLGPLEAAPGVYSVRGQPVTCTGEWRPRLIRIRTSARRLRRRPSAVVLSAAGSSSPKPCGFTNTRSGMRCSSAR